MIIQESYREILTAIQRKIDEFNGSEGTENGMVYQEETVNISEITYKNYVTVITIRDNEISLSISKQRTNPNGNSIGENPETLRIFRYAGIANNKIVHWDQITDKSIRYKIEPFKSMGKGIIDMPAIKLANEIYLKIKHVEEICQ